MIILNLQQKKISRLMKSSNFKKQFIIILLVIGAGICWPVIKVLAQPLVRIFDVNGFNLEQEFNPFVNLDVTGLSVAVLDFDGNGLNEVAVSAGRGERPLVRLFNYQGWLLTEFPAYAENYQLGLKVVAADLDGDGRDEILTGPLDGGSPHLRIFQYQPDGFVLINEFFPFDKDLRNGLNLAVGDVNNDSQPEIIVSQNLGGEPKVRIYNKKLSLLNEFEAYSNNFKGGVNLAVSDLDRDGQAEIITGAGSGGGPHVRVFNDQGQVKNQFFAYQENFKGGVSLAVADLDHNPSPEIITGAGFGGGPHIRIFDRLGQPKLISNFFSFDHDFRGGVEVAVGDVDNDGLQEIIAATAYLPKLNPGSYRYIEVDLSQQKLFAYQRGDLVKEFLISSGTGWFPSPTGNFRVYRKRESARMTWFYGLDNPNNYDLPGVPNILSFLGPYTIHGTYWHNNFGQPMSHGCINMTIADSKWLYDWADLETSVIIH